MNVCVFASSSAALLPAHGFLAAELGRELARAGHTLVFGGCHLGLMGVLVKAVKEHGGRAVGVIPAELRARGRASEICDELVITTDLRERKAVMAARSDAFVALPGGIGTVDELAEALTLRLLRLHAKPVLVLDHAGYWAPLLALLGALEERQATPGLGGLYEVVTSAAGVIARLGRS
jgi:hypothetical protein